MSRKLKTAKFLEKIKNKEKNKLKNPNKEESIRSAVNLAYGDAKRTMTGIGNYDRETVRGNLAQKFKEYFSKEAPIDASSFDKEHKEMCKIWCQAFQDIDSNIGTYGKAQKIVNMAFKYLYCCEEIEGYEDHFKFCHVPLDSYTIEWFQRECKKQKHKITKTHISKWSSILEYGDENTEQYKNSEKEFYTYFYFQKWFREWYLNDETTPLLAEFENWSEIQMSLVAEAFYFAYENITDQSKKENFKDKLLDEKLELIKEALSRT